MASSNLTPSTDDWDFTSIPEANVDTSGERRVASISRTKKWKEIKEYIDGRITAYQQYVPGVNPAITGSEADWRVADGIARELTALKRVVEEISSGVSGK